MTKLVPAAFAIAVALLALAACGGDGDETTAALTKAEFIAQGDEICEQGDKAGEARLEEFAEENGIDLENPTKEQQEEAVTEVFAASLDSQAEGLRDLGTPEGDEGEVDEILGALESAVEELEDEPNLLFEEKATGLNEAAALAGEYGFESCGS
ncbi:MAG: hypothetical protein R2725_07800 [Solirubrobacterales bacterium]